MTRPKPKTVKAWAFGVRCADGRSLVQLSNGRRADMRHLLKYWRDLSATVGPVVRIEVPAPKGRKR